MSTTQLKCQCCTSTEIEFLQVEGCYLCKSCGSKFSNSSFKINSTLMEATDKRNRLDCEGALEILEELNSKGNYDSDIYFAKVLAKYGVIYVDDKNDPNRKIPTISRASTTPVMELEDAVKTLENASNTTIKDYYDRCFDEIERLRRKIIDTANKEEPYEIFICYKKTDGDNYTKDAFKARELYENLTNGKYGHLYKTFYADESLKEYAGEDYEPIIYNALHTAKIMIVVAASKADYLSSDWVRNEWARYSSIIKEDEKKQAINHRLVPVLFDGFKPENLPSVLASYQAMVYDANFNDEFKSILAKYIKKGISSNLKRNNTIEVNIKPIELEERVIERRGFAKATSGAFLTASVTTKIESIEGLLSGKIGRDTFKRVAEYAEEVLKENPENSLAAMYYVMSIYKRAKLTDLYSFENNLDDKMVERISLSLEYAKKIEYSKRFNVYKKMMLNSIRLSEVKQAIMAYNLLVSFSEDDETAIKITTEAVEVVADCIKDYKNCTINNFEAANRYMEVFYPVLTKLGAEMIIYYYNLLGMKFFNTERYVDAIKYFNKSLELFAAEPNALWYRMLAESNSHDEIEFAKKCKEPIVLVDVLSTMLSGGYIIKNDDDNFFIKSRNVCLAILDLGQKAKCNEIYKKLYELIPNKDEYIDLAYETSIIFPELLNVKGDFEISMEYYKEVLASDSTDLRAHFGSFRTVSHCKTNFDLLRQRKGFSLGKYKTNFDSIREAEAKKGLNKDTSRMLFLDKIHTQIRDLSHKSRSNIYAAIEYADKICDYYLVSPSIDYICNTLTSDMIGKLCMKENVNLLAETIILDFGPENIRNKEAARLKVQSICKNARFGDKTLSMNVIKELLLVGIPAAFIWIMYAFSHLSADDMVDWIWPSGFTTIAIVSAVIVGIIIIATSADIIGGVIGGAMGGALISAVICGILTGLAYGLTSLSDILYENRSIYVGIAFGASLLPYGIYKVVDVVKKHSYINKKYILSTSFHVILALISPIISVIIY